LDNVDIFYCYLECFKDIWDIVWTFGICCVQLVHFCSFGIMHQEKSGNPATNEGCCPRSDFRYLKCWQNKKMSISWQDRLYSTDPTWQHTAGVRW
jgi:hypothetical protein